MPAKSDLSTLNCSLARALGEIGDQWSLLIVRDAFLGATRFVQFQASSRMAKNILADRLASLVQAGLLDRQGQGARPTYHLTEKGRALVPALIALTQWGDAWQSGGAPPILFSDDQGNLVAPVRLQTLAGAALGPEAIKAQAGPGANPRTSAYLDQLGRA